MVKTLFFTELFVLCLRSERFSEESMFKLLMPCKNDMRVLYLGVFSLSYLVLCILATGQ